MSGALGVHRGGEKVPAVFLVVIVFSEGGGGGGWSKQVGELVGNTLGRKACLRFMTYGCFFVVQPTCSVFVVVVGMVVVVGIAVTVVAIKHI